MQGIDADAAGARRGGKAQQVRQIGKVTMPPIAPGADAVELDGNEPDASSTGAGWRLIGLGRRDDKPELRRRLLRTDRVDPWRQRPGRCLAVADDFFAAQDLPLQ